MIIPHYKLSIPFMPLQTQFITFFISPFSESSASAELNNFLKSHRIINIEKRLIDGERGTAKNKICP